MLSLDFDYEAAFAGNVAMIELPSALGYIIERIARTGSLVYAWPDLQRLFRLKLAMVNRLNSFLCRFIGFIQLRFYQSIGY